MEFGIEEIRRAFSKASIALDGRGISICYTYRGGWFDQSINVKDTMEWLLSNSDGFSVSIRVNKLIRLRFFTKLPMDTLALYPPIDDSAGLSLDEMRSVIDYDSDNVADFVQFFYDVDLSDNEAIMRRLGEFIDRASDDEVVRHLPQTERFLQMRGISQRILSDGFICDVESSEPDESTGTGFIEFSIDDESHIPDVVKGDLKNGFAKLLGISSDFAIEGSVCDGVLNMDFFV